jgi:Zn-dependent protease
MRLTQLIKRQFTIARVYGIPIRIDYRWFAVVALSIWLIASNLQSHAIQLGNVNIQPLPPATAWLLGLITTAGLFMSVFGHELSHALMARAEGIEIEEIVLHPFGGLARMRNAPQNPRAELRIAIAGPAASFLFGVLALAAARVAVIGNYAGTFIVFFLLAAGNFLLVMFNLFPGYPLDGGRVLRALLWHRSGNIQDATRKAGLCGILIGGVLILFGVYIMIAPNWRPTQPYFMGGWSIVVGLFLLDAAAKVVKAAQDARLVSVSDVMSHSIVLDPGLTVSRLVDDILPLHRQTSFPVAAKGRLHGILSLEDLKSLPRERWPDTAVHSVMHPIGPRLFVAPSTTLEAAIQLMKQNGVGSIAVIDAYGDLIGFLQSGKIRRLPKTTSQ